LRKDTQTQ